MNEKNIALAILGIVAVLAIVGLILLFTGQKIAGASQFSLPAKESTTQARASGELGERWMYCDANPKDPRCEYRQERDYRYRQSF